MSKILKYIVLAAIILLGLYALYSYSQYTPILICIVFSILFLEWMYLKSFKNKKRKWSNFMQELEDNYENADWLYKEKDKVEFLLTADWINKKTHKNKLRLIEDKIDRIKLNNEQIIESLKNEICILENKIEELEKRNQSQTKPQKETEEFSQLATGENFSKINYIRVINTLYRLGFYNDNKKDVMQKMGLLLNIDLSGYNNDLSQGFSKTTIEKQISIFLDMKEAYEKEYHERLTKQEK